MLGLTLFACAAITNAYSWPSPQLDALESARFDQFGHNSHGIASFIEPCNLFLFGPNSTGRANVADWIRTVYHDMATHNATDGTGGMDASIRFAEEQARTEDAGNGFGHTIATLFTQSSRYISIADVLALGAVIAIENCGGPEIAFRGGRVDAVASNNPGVPEPQQDLESHIASFARQGFSQVEMIGLVACGHTFGGVQHTFFPDIVPELNDPYSTEDVAHFDSTFVTFDNNIATEYICGTTTNPLVVGFNDTTNSDKRIFESDGNVTMLSFANSPGLFASTCADLFARMLNTVPAGVKLTEIIRPLLVKPFNVQLILSGNTLKFSGEVRFWDTTEDPTRTVRLLWEDHVGRIHNGTLGFSGVSTSTAGRYSAAWYSFNTNEQNPFLSIDAAAGIKSIRFTVNGKLEDQGGIGFAVQDGVVFSKTSCTASADADADPGHFDVAVRNGVHPTRVYLEQKSLDSVQRPIIIEIDIAPPVKPPPANAVYSIWRLPLNGSVLNAFLPYTIGAEIDGVKYSTNDEHMVIDFPPCKG
ncbi:heme peroxidase [Mycena maculata]|uniref:Peroxidase n=1 Tax=Mycena maculata TaxID=230809 RepID=A0AAD7MTC6_9AGAR|nr:heme peroxidase [Mycena maculata]